MTADTDSLLAEKAGTDPAAFAELFDRYYPRVFTYFRYRCGDDAAADDLAAQVFEGLLDGLRRYRRLRGPFAPWIFTIARNKANDHWRRIGRRRQVTLDAAEAVPDAAPGPETHMVACQEEEALLEALAELPERERDVLGLKFAGGFTNREIARLMGLGESHVGVLVYRSVKTLRVKLEQNHG